MRPVLSTNAKSLTEKWIGSKCRLLSADLNCRLQGAALMDGVAAESSPIRKLLS